MTRQVACVAGVMALVATVSDLPLCAQAAAANQLKAAIISKLPQFIEWPATATSGRDTVDICVGPPNPFGNDLPELVAGDTVGGRPVAVRTLASADQLTGCHLLYVPAPGTTTGRALLQKAATLPVVTIGDDSAFVEAGGIVHLRSIGGRMRFDINVAAARKVGLRISAQLLQLAASVQERP